MYIHKIIKMACIEFRGIFHQEIYILNNMLPLRFAVRATIPLVSWAIDFEKVYLTAIRQPTPRWHDDYRVQKLEGGFDGGTKCRVIAPECLVTDRSHRTGGGHSRHKRTAQEITASPQENEAAFLKSSQRIHSENLERRLKALHNILNLCGDL